ncbi:MULTISPECIES: hypothetical protein [Falsihalocynthiibacter]|nr:hypothetical protein [Falsihalocynthiibacter arcticus]
MKLILKVVLGLVVLAFVAVVAFGYIGDLTPEQEEIRIPVSISDQ